MPTHLLQCWQWPARIRLHVPTYRQAGLHSPSASWLWPKTLCLSHNINLSSLGKNKRAELVRVVYITSHYLRPWGGSGLTRPLNNLVSLNRQTAQIGSFCFIQPSKRQEQSTLKENTSSINWNCHCSSNLTKDNPTFLVKLGTLVLGRRGILFVNLNFLHYPC